MLAAEETVKKNVLGFYGIRPVRATSINNLRDLKPGQAEEYIEGIRNTLPSSDKSWPPKL